MRAFKGCGTALVTPFKSDEGVAAHVDYEAFAATVDWQVATGMDFLVPLGTTGETPTLSDSEKLQVLEVCRRHAAGLPVVAGVGSNSIAGTAANMRLLQDADAFLVVVPFYNKPPQRGLYEYFKAVAALTPKPVILYNVPGRTGTNLEADTTLALARDIPNIVGIKEASGKFEQIKAILDGRPEDFCVLSGNDEDTLSLMKEGADGVISVASNVFPSAMADFVHALQDGRYSEAEGMDRQLQPLFKALFVEPNPIPAKAAMAQLGLMENSLRLPLVKASEATEQLLKETLKDLF
ncbi:MAG: 4-hydroxy-tetrahydrodipicolinate synthase [Bacteroidales bacterium]|nr:4-hydroxy-tetrahydrodipicolinate synthase [Bacteroidales bacterium]MBP5374023.1 4-hydroxy-tetrahydrodipicolinate synthase [Bacteroidales bacterium]